MADINRKIMLKKPFLIFNNIRILFTKKKLIWRSYTIVKALFTTKEIKLINKKEFAKVILDKGNINDICSNPKKIASSNDNLSFIISINCYLKIKWGSY